MWSGSCANESGTGECLTTCGVSGARPSGSAIAWQSFDLPWFLCLRVGGLRADGPCNVPKAANEQSLTPRSSPDIHGADQQACARSTPISEPHPYATSEALAQKLSVGFGVKFPVAVEFSDWILEASARQQMQPELIASPVFASSFRKYAQSHVGAGPAQVRPHYWGEFCGQADLYDPEQNIYCGSQVLGFCWSVAMTSACALAALQYRYELHALRRRFALHR